MLTRNAVDAYTEHAVDAYTDNAVGVEAFMDNAVDGYTEGVVEGYTGNAGVSDNDMKQAESSIQREEKAENFMAGVVSQPTTKAEVVNNDMKQAENFIQREKDSENFMAGVVQYEAETEDSSGYSIREEVLAEQLREQLEVFPPTRELRGGRAEGRDEVHREGAEGHQVQGVLGGQEEEVSEDEGELHLSTQVSPVYWMAPSATNL